MTPRDYSESRLQKSYEFSKLGERLIELKKQYAMKYPAIRSETTSIVEADRKWATSQEGLEEFKIKIKMKSLEKEISALRTALEVANNEMHNQY